MKLNLKILLADKFIRGTFVLTAVTFLSSALNYLVHPLLTRRLTIPEYGDYQALLSFLTVLGIISVVISTAFTKEFSILSASAPEEIRSLRRRASSRLFYVGLILFALVAASSVFLNKLFKISQSTTIIITALSLVCAFPLVVNRALLTGRQYFSALSLNNFLDAFSRLALVAILVVFWPLGLIGASFALGLSGLLPFIISFWQIKKVGLPSVAKDFSGSFKKIWHYGFLVLWFTVLTQFFYNFDMLFVKSFFSPEEAGLYGALLTIGRIVFFIGGAVPIVMFPVVANLKQDESLRKYKVLGKSLALMTALAVPTAAFIALFPTLVIRIVVGVKYLSLAVYLPTFAFVILLLTLLTVLAQYFLALSKRRGLLVLTAAAAGEIILLLLFHDNIWSVVYSLLFVFGAASLALLILFFNDYRAAREKLKEGILNIKKMENQEGNKTKNKIDLKILKAELVSMIREFYPYFLGFYILALLISLWSRTWQSFFYWPAFHGAIIFFTILFISSFIRSIINFFIVNSREKILKILFSLIRGGLRKSFFWIRRKLRSIKRRDWLKVFVIVVVLAGALFRDIDPFEFLILLYALISFLFILNSRWSAGIALVFLIICPVSLILKERTALAETFAIYAYYFLIIAVLTQIRELWRENKRKITANIEENNN